MIAATFLALAQQCAPGVAPATLAAIVRVESGFNPLAIGVVHGHLVRQPATIDEAVATAHALDAAGWNYSAGVAQLNRSNWYRLGLDGQSVFDTCRNLAGAARILRECYARASDTGRGRDDVMGASLSCYTSGNLTNGYRTGYVMRVVVAAVQALPVVPDIVQPSSSPAGRNGSNQENPAGTSPDVAAFRPGLAGASEHTRGATSRPAGYPAGTTDNGAAGASASAVVF